MHLSQTVEYALRAAVWLAGRAGQAQTTAQIAKGTQVPASYLSKVLQQLGRADLVSSQRGVGGGFTLARAAADISLLEIVDAVEPLRRIRSCPLGLEAHGNVLCPLHTQLDQALAFVEQSFRTTRLSDLVPPDQALQPLCLAATSTPIE